MSGFSLGAKSQQSQIFTSEGVRIPTTFIKTKPCYLVNIQWHQPNYFSVTLGFGLKKNIKKTTKGQLEKAGIKAPLRFLKEIRINPEKNKISMIEEEGKKGLSFDDKKIFIGEEIKASLLFKNGDKVTVSGTSKGKGFQGVVKRHGFAGGPKTHGQSDRHRAPGSIGQTTTPGRVYKGKRMAGHMGSERVTIKNLLVIDANDEGLTVKGLVPGGVNNLLEIKSA